MQKNPEWARNIGAGISKFLIEALPYLEKGEIGIAGMETYTAIWVIEEGFKKIPGGSVQIYTMGLLSGMKLFAKNCQEQWESENTDVERLKHLLKNYIKNKLFLVLLAINPFLAEKIMPDKENLLLKV